MSSRRNKRYKKNKENSQIETSNQTQKKSSNSELISNAKKFLDLDLSNMSIANQLKYKEHLEILQNALELNTSNDENHQKLFELYTTINKKILSLKLDITKKKFEILPFENEKKEAENYYKKKVEEYEKKDKIQHLYVEKGNKINEEKEKMIKDYDEIRNNLINEAQEFVKELQRKTDPEEPERKKLLEENTRLKNEINDTLKEGLKMKEEFDKKMNMEDFYKKNFSEEGKLSMENTMNNLKDQTQNDLMLNTELKSQLIALQRKNEELNKINEMAHNEFQKIDDEIKNKSNEIFLLANENNQIRIRLNSGVINKTELKKLNDVYESEKKKLQVMKSLNKKYEKQVRRLLRELYPQPPVIEDECGCGHDHGHSHIGENEHNHIHEQQIEHQHEHEHQIEHQHEHEHQIEHQHEHEHEHEHQIEHQHEHQHEHQIEHQIEHQHEHEHKDVEDKKEEKVEDKKEEKIEDKKEEKIEDKKEEKVDDKKEEKVEDKKEESKKEENNNENKNN